MNRTLSIALSFIGLLVGAGFATGQEVVQYFTSFGAWGLWGIAIAGTIMALAGTVFLQLGSYFNASAHSDVFRKVTHPWISRFMDACVVFTLFAIGMVMLAGAGSNLEQQFGFAPWIGSAIMLVLVMACGMLDVDKVSQVIGGLTPLIIIAVVGMAIYTAVHLPEDVGAAMEIAAETESPINHWLLSALNYAGLALILAVSMSLVIGGDNISPRDAGRGGLVGGLCYAVLMGLAGFVLIMNADVAAHDDIPMLSLVNDIHPWLGLAMAVTIYLMIFNTAIGMFYALGKRLTSKRPHLYRPVFIAGCLAGFAFSFVGFRSLMASVYPILGYLGIILVAVLVVAWVRGLSKIKDEAVRRERIRALLTLKLHPDREYDDKYDEEIGQHVVDSNMEDADLYQELVAEVSEALDGDDAVDFSLEEFEEVDHDVTDYTELDGVETDRTEEEIAAFIEETSSKEDLEAK
ncbi:hypothetical protein [Corynebacterium lizhenjunii]|uniref:YkvI family membrane protein n=1 Tax=Corynebacterium lizhenjunii TaxID=2709394 RepID=UPI0013ED9B14|nr:hypothetical protein [Corynebacterium lizhenjunii]